MSLSYRIRQSTTAASTMHTESLSIFPGALLGQASAEILTRMPGKNDIVSMAAAMTLDPEKIARSAGDLPAFPAIAMQALQLCEDPRTSARQIQYVIAKDQALTARILKVVNSALYYLSREVSTLSHAIAIMGFDTVRSIIVAASVQGVFHAGGQRAHGLAAQLLWQHSWGAGVAAKALAVDSRYNNPDEAFIAGLLHDIGKMVLIKNRPHLYGEVINAVHQGQATFHQAEIERLGFSHAHLGSLVASKWQFPEQLVVAIRDHHEGKLTAPHSHLTAIVALANRCMQVLQIGFEKNPELMLENEPAAQHLRLEQPAIQKLVSEVQMILSKSPGFEKN